MSEPPHSWSESTPPDPSSVPSGPPSTPPSGTAAGWPTSQPTGWPSPSAGWPAQPSGQPQFGNPGGGSWGPAAAPGAGWGPQAAPQPGWGPQAAPQPGWGQPYGGAYGGYGAGQWAWTGSSWVWAPAPPRSFLGRHKVAIVLSTIALVFVLIVGACMALVIPAAVALVNIQTNSHGLVTNVEYVNGTVEVFVKPGVTEAQAVDLACNVVRPSIKGSVYAQDPFEIISSSNTVLADQDTPCP